MDRRRLDTIEYGIVAVLAVLSYLIVMWLLTGKGFLSHNTYNSYALQADAWWHGRLDLGQDYSYLELAHFNGKYYVSFPPFPSYILFPLAFIFGSNTPDGLILWIEDIVTIIYLYKLALKFIKDARLSALTALFVMLGTNVTFNMLNPWVWFWAQTLCFMLAVMSIYYAYEGKGGLSLGLWACSVGCRPMQAVFIPVLLYILIKGEIEKLNMQKPEIETESTADEAKICEENNKAEDNIEPVDDIWGNKSHKSSLISNVAAVVKKRAVWAIAPCVIALSYMILNYARFGSITEFGHNYLPEFVEAEHGQFDVWYLKGNLKMLFHLPQLDDEGRMIIDHFGNLNFLIVSPFIIFALIMLVILIIKKEYEYAVLSGSIVLLSTVYLIITMRHKTMGGWHFGNRYTNDILPWLYLITVLGLSKVRRAGKYQIPLFIFGICLNAVGLVVVYNGMSIG